jgi:hypothetical protein
MNARSKLRLPQGLKPTPYKALCGTAEAVPSQKLSGTKPCPPKSDGRSIVVLTDS